MSLVTSVKIKKCPFCNFLNAHDDTITHHIKFSDDETHRGIDIQILDRSFYVIIERVKVNSKSRYGPYVSKLELPLRWIYCLWCPYRDKIEFDLSLHFLEEHKDELMAIPITRKERLAFKALIKDSTVRFFSKFESPMEYRLDKAVKMAKEKGIARNAR